MRVRLDRVRGPLDVGQVRQIPLDRLHRTVVTQHRPRLAPRRGQQHTLNKHRSSQMIYVMDGSR
jgi:hypothetical protein